MMEVSDQVHIPAVVSPGGERVFATHSVGGWVGQTIGIGVLEMRKMLPLLGIEQRFRVFPARIPVTVLTMPPRHITVARTCNLNR